MEHSLKDVLKLYSGLEHISNNNYHSEEAIYLITIHNQRMGKTYNRPIPVAMYEDGFESIMGTIREWTASVSRTMSNWFNDYDKKELDRIEKEVKGGLEAFKEASIKDTIEALERFRKLFYDRFDAHYDSIKDKSFIKGLSKSESKDKILKEIDHTLTGLKNSKMKDFYLGQIKKESEKVMLRIVAKLSYLKNTQVKFKTMLDKKYIYDFLLDVGFKGNDLKELKTGGDTIIKKLEMLDKNGVVYYDIIKSKVFLDVQNYNVYLMQFLNQLLNDVIKLNKILIDNGNLSPKEKLTLGNNKSVYTVETLRGTVYYTFIYLETTIDSLNDFALEVSNDVNQVSLALTGLPVNLIEIFKQEKK